MVAADISKCLLVLINIIFTIFGLAVLVLGILFKLGWDEVRKAFKDGESDNLQQAGDTVAMGAIIFGAFILVISLVGCIGACGRVKCLLVLYAIVVMLILIGQIIVVALVVSFGTNNKDEIAKSLRKSLKNYHEDGSDDNSKAYSAIFNSLKCCGITNYTSDFTTDDPNLPFYPAAARDQTKYPPKIPITCCKNFDYEGKYDVNIFDKNSACLATPNSDNAYTKGCLDEIFDWTDKQKAVTIGVGVSIFVIELLVVILSLFLCCHEDQSKWERV